MAHALLQSVRIGWPDVQLALRSALAAGVSLVAAFWLGLEYPIYAFIAAVIVTDLKPGMSQTLGLRRIGATIIGAACGASLTSILPGGAWSVGAGVFLAMIAAQLLGAGEGARVAGYISGIVLLDHSTAPWSYALYRFLETALGVLVAWSISFVPKLIGRNGKTNDLA
jgi:uncharacterized membrane protein YgaE (UPF0421/DUF939 family)